MSSVTVVTDHDFEREVSQSALPVLAAFLTHGSGPEKRVMKTVGRLATEMDGKIKVVVIDPTINAFLRKKYRTYGHAACIFFHNGATLWGIEGEMFNKSPLEGAQESIKPKTLDDCINGVSEENPRVSGLYEALSNNIEMSLASLPPRPAFMAGSGAKGIQPG